MRKLISMFMILTLVVSTTIAPSASHAMPHDGLKVEKTQAFMAHDCHGHDEATITLGETAQNDHDTSPKKPCCKKGMCKCLGGACHNGLSQMLGNAGSPLYVVTARKSRFGFANEFADSSLPSLLKRPPRA